MLPLLFFQNIFIFGNILKRIVWNLICWHSSYSLHYSKRSSLSHSHCNISIVSLWLSLILIHKIENIEKISSLSWCCLVDLIRTWIIRISHGLICSWWRIICEKILIIMTQQILRILAIILGFFLILLWRILWKIPAHRMLSIKKTLLLMRFD